MGSSIDRYLENIPAGNTQGGPGSTRVDDYTSARPPREDVARLTLSTQHGNPANADRAARILKLQDRLKLPAELIDRNLDEIEQKATAANYDPETLRRSSPAVAGWLAEHPNHASVAGDDIEKLSTIENIFMGLATYKGFGAGAFTAIQGRRSGAAQAELGRLGHEALNRGGVNRLDRSTQARIAKLERDVAREPGGMEFLDRVLFRGSQLFGQMASSAPRALTSGLAGASAGALAGAAGGPASPVTAPAGAAGGFAVGLASGFAWDSFQIEGGMAYLELSHMLQENGEPIDEGTRRSIATAVGAVNALLETTGVAAIAAPFRTVARKLMRESVKDAFVRPTMRAALNDFGRSYFTAIATETGTEVAQELTNVIGEELARSGNAGELGELLADPEKREAMIRRLSDIAQQTAEGMVLVGLPGASLHGATTAYQARKASQREQFYLALGEAIQGSKTFERLPEAMQALVERATAGSPIETVYAPVETWDTYWQSAKIDPAAAAEELGVREQWEEAHRTGGDIAIPISKYATKLAPTEHNAFFAKELRARPNEMNARESAEFLDRMKQEAEQDAPAEQQPAGEQVVSERIATQLVAAGFDESTAKTYAKMYETAFRTLGARSGLDPLQLFERYNLSVTAPEQAAPAAPIGERVSLEEVANRAMASRERQAEMEGKVADEANEPQTPYAVKRGLRDAVMRNEQKEFVYARTEKGSLRGNLTTVSTDGLIEELAYLFEARQADRSLEERFNAWAESGEAAFVDALPDAERTGKSRRTTDQFGNKIKRQAEDLPDADATLDPERLAEMRQLERDYRKASRSIEARQKSVARIEAELQRRGVANADEKLFHRIAGGDVDFDPTTFQQPPRSALIDRFVALRTAEANQQLAPAVREEAGKRAADIEQRARAEYQAILDAANAAFEAKHGKEAARVFHQSAFHGSPHIFDKFSLHKIGTGEGAQAYGWGLYFAGKKDVAEWYRKALSGRTVLFRGEQVADTKGMEVVWPRDSEMGFARRRAIETVAQTGSLTDAKWAVREYIKRYSTYAPHSIPFNESVLAELEGMSKADVTFGPQGRLYEVDIPEDETYLDWDKPLSAQSPFVQTVLRRAGLFDEKTDLGTFAGQPVSGAPVEGVEFYRTLASTLGKDRQLATHVDGGYSVRTSDEEAASRQLASLGINGIRYRDEGSRDIRILAPNESTSGKWVVGPRIGDREDQRYFDDEQEARAHFDSLVSYNYVVFDDQLVQVTRFEQAFPGGDAPRGQIKFKVGDQAAVSIELLADADLSTFLHETGHFYLEVMRDLATQPDASVDITTDYEIIRTWLNAKAAESFTREQHEKFARGFEAYLMEGKAPAAELRPVFARFRAWLVGLYRSLENLHVFLSDDVRQVFDRLLAAEDEIAAAQREQKMDPLFADPAAVGMTEQQAASYRDAVLEARTTAENELARRLIDDVRREQDAVYKAERAKVRLEVAEEVNDERDSAAFAFLSRGTMPDGSPLPAELEAAKLSKQELEGEYADRYPNLMARLRSRFLYAKAGGVHPDQVAEWFGYASGDELIQALLAYEGTPRQRIERLTDERMRADDPNLVTPAELPIEAMKAVHNEKRAQVLHLELQHLASENLPALKGLIRRVSRRIPPLNDVKAQADRIIRNKKVRDINPLLYQRAEEKAARMAVDALLRGDVEAAFDEKQRELLNHELYRAASKAREEMERVATDFGRFALVATRERLGKAGGDYLAQIDAILERFDFRKGVSLSQIDRRRSLREWYQEQLDEGLAPIIPEKLLDEAYRTHYKELTVDELRELHAAVLSIEHLAKLKNKLLASARARDLEEARTEIIAAIASHHDLRQKPEGHAPEDLRRRLVKGAKRGLAEHTRMEFLFDFLDGFKGLGIVWQYLFKPFADAETAENEMRANDAQAMRDIFAVYTAKERAEWFTKKVFVPGARSSKHDGNFTKASIIAAALNWGNDYNREALMIGYDWTLSGAESVLAQLDQRDWQTVQRIWDHIESYWPQIEQLEKDLVGVAPQKVEATGFTMKGVELRGGYYPILFDRERSVRQFSLDEKSNVQEAFGGNAFRAMTRHGHTIERTSTGGKPLKLELSGLADHMGQVVHDLTHRRAVIDVYRLVSEPDIAKAIELAVGREMYLQLRPWLVAIAGDRARSYSGFTERLLGRARQGATVVGLGLKVTSAALQALGYFNTVNELGAKYAGTGLREAVKDPRKFFSMVKETGFIGQRSGMMRDRLQNYDRDVRDYARKQNAIEGAEVAWFYFIGYMDLATSIPTWLGAYRKAMDGALEGVEKGDEQQAIDYADKIVRETQAAGAAKDLASIQRGGEAMRLFTMFYSSMSILFNQLARAGQRFVLERNAPQLVATLALIWFAPVVLEAAIRGEQPDDDDSWAKFYARKIAAFPFGAVVLFRDIANAIERRLEFGRFDFRGSPAGEVGQTIGEAIYALGFKPFTDEDITRADWKDIVNAVGYSAKLPTAQLWKTAEYLYDWITGVVEPDNIVSGIYRAAVTGKPRP